MVKRLLLSIFLSATFFMTGCSTICAKYTTQKPLEYVYVQEPIPAPPVVNRPALKVFEITATSSDGDVAVYYRTDLEQLKNYAYQLEQIVAKYRELSNKKEETTKNGK